MGGNHQFLNQLPFFFTSPAFSQVAIPVEKHARLLGWMDLIVEEFNHPVATPLGILRVLVELILLEAERIIDIPAATPKTARARTLARQFLLKLEEGQPLNVSVSEIAHSLHISERQLVETLRREVGKSPRMLIEERLALEVKRLLVDPSLTIAEVGYALGFENASHFSRFFRRHAGLSPREFREPSFV